MGLCYTKLDVGSLILRFGDNAKEIWRFSLDKQFQINIQFGFRFVYSLLVNVK